MQEDDKLMAVQDIFLEKLNTVCEKFGLNNIMAQLYVILYLNSKPLSLSDMVKELQISKGSVSINIRALERYGAVKRVWVKGSRKDYYEAEPDIARVIMQRVRAMASDRLSEIDDMLKSSYDMLNSADSQNGGTNERREMFKEKLKTLKDLHEKAKSMFELLNSTLLKGALL